MPVMCSLSLLVCLEERINGRAEVHGLITDSISRQGELAKDWRLADQLCKLFGITSFEELAKVA